MDDEVVVPDDASVSESSEEPSGPVDQLGIPMSREPTLDDVRSDGEDHRRLAVGCTVIVALLLVGFYLVRVLLLR